MREEASDGNEWTERRFGLEKARKKAAAFSSTFEHDKLCVCVRVCVCVWKRGIEREGDRDEKCPERETSEPMCFEAVAECEACVPFEWPSGFGMFWGRLVVNP